MANYTIGVDLGQSRDYTALVLVERLEAFSGREKVDIWGAIRSDPDDRYHVRHIERFALGTPYPAIVDSVGTLLESPELAGQTVLVLDATGVGRAVVDMFVDAYKQGHLGHYWPVPITITGGQEAHGRNVPKRDLVSRLQALLQTGRLKIAEGLPLVDVLTKELLAFRAKVSKGGHDTYEAWRESDHDDLVLALALACFRRHRKTAPRYITRKGEAVEYADLGR